MDEEYDKEYEWFSYYISVTSVLVFIIIWSILPEGNGADPLHSGIFKAILDVLPQRNWVIYGQCFTLMGMLYTYFGILMYNEDMLTPPLDDLRTITDSKGEVAVIENETRMLEKFAFEESSGIIDLPIMDVCEILYAEEKIS